jgi:ribosomal protein S18 acetylase RimI-like enzyme
MKLVSADHYSLAQLTEAYNQTRVDYIVPMPMNEARLREYIQCYDVDLSASWVAVEGSIVLGLGMLGIREGRAWITRVGVLPSGRRRGIGRKIIEALLTTAEKRNLGTVWLEVIKGNSPAYELFRSCGFKETRELLVARRPPKPNLNGHDLDDNEFAKGQVTSLDRKDVLELLASRKTKPNWLNENESLWHFEYLSGLRIDLSDQEIGWACFHPKMLQLTNIVVDVIEGDPAIVSSAVLGALHKYYSTQDAIMENLPVSDPIWPGFQAAGYFDSFRRIEMKRV